MGKVYYKNGMMWWSRGLVRVVGEERWDGWRVQRRAWWLAWYYARQRALYRLFVDYTDIANSVGVYPKLDSSHGFPQLTAYETFRDAQENSLNSEGYFGMFVVCVCAIYSGMTIYSYILPYYWSNYPIRREEETRRRITDYYSSTAGEELVGNQVSELVLTPHTLHRVRRQWMQSYRNPDDARLLFLTSFARAHRYREHYLSGEVTHSMVDL